MSIKTSTPTPVTCTVREHPRAKRVIFRVDPRQGLTVTVPPGFNRDLLPDMLARKSEWIAAAVARLRSQGLDPLAKPRVPDIVRLAACGQNLAVIAHKPRAAPRLTEKLDRLTLAGPPERHLDLLRSWLKRRARIYLNPRLDALANATGLKFSKTSYRLQRGRWGSCSAQKNISLNAKLIFLPPALADHVLLHELCHTRIMNHSPEYWTLVRSIQPHARELEFKLRSAWKYVPNWV